MNKDEKNEKEEFPIWRKENEDGTPGEVLDWESQKLMEEVFKTFINEDGETIEQVINKKNKTK